MEKSEHLLLFKKYHNLKHKYMKLKSVYNEIKIGGSGTGESVSEEISDTKLPKTIDSDKNFVNQTNNISPEREIIFNFFKTYFEEIFENNNLEFCVSEVEKEDITTYNNNKYIIGNQPEYKKSSEKFNKKFEDFLININMTKAEEFSIQKNKYGCFLIYNNPDKDRQIKVCFKIMSERGYDNEIKVNEKCNKRFVNFIYYSKKIKFGEIFNYGIIISEYYEQLSLYHICSEKKSVCYQSIIPGLKALLHLHENFIAHTHPHLNNFAKTYGDIVILDFDQINDTFFKFYMSNLTPEEIDDILYSNAYIKYDSYYNDSLIGLNLNGPSLKMYKSILNTSNDIEKLMIRSFRHFHKRDKGNILFFWQQYVLLYEDVLFYLRKMSKLIDHFDYEKCENEIFSLDYEENIIDKNEKIIKIVEKYVSTNNYS